MKCVSGRHTDLNVSGDVSRPMVCDSILAEVVGSNPLRLRARPHLELTLKSKHQICVLYLFSGEKESTHLLLSCRVPLLCVFTHHALVQPGPQHAHGGVSVLQLRATLLTLGCYPCGDNREDA